MYCVKQETYVLPTRVHPRFSSRDIPDGSCNSSTPAHHRHQDPACQPSVTSRPCPALQMNPTSRPCSSRINPRASWPTCNVLGREPATNLRYSPPGSLLLPPGSPSQGSRPAAPGGIHVTPHNRNPLCGSITSVHQALGIKVKPTIGLWVKNYPILTTCKV